METYDDLDDIDTDKKVEPQQEETEVWYIGEYLNQCINWNQVEYYEGFWLKLLNFFAPQRTAVIFRHMKQKFAYVDISVYDLVWIIFLCVFVLTTGTTILGYWLIDKKFQKEYDRHHVVSRYYQQIHQLPATEHPDYVRQINDIIPCKDYNTLITWKLNKRFATETNYYYVAKRDGYAYLQEVSDEEYERAVEKLKGRKKAERGQQILLEYQKRRKEQLKNQKK